MAHNCDDRKSPAITLDKGTMLALERTRFAAERTLMAWIRTALSLIGFGFMITKFFECLSETRGKSVQGPLGTSWESGTVGLTLIATGVLILILALVNHQRDISEIRAHGVPIRGVGYGLAFNVAALLSVLGVTAFIVLLIS